MENNDLFYRLIYVPDGREPKYVPPEPTKKNIASKWKFLLPLYLICICYNITKINFYDHKQRLRLKSVFSSIFF